MTDAFITQRPRCNWLIEVYDDEDNLVYEADDGKVTHVCGRAAVVVYSQKNPKRGPGEPNVLRYPRCKVHDTQAGRDRAGLMGMDITEVP